MTDSPESGKSKFTFKAKPFERVNPLGPEGRAPSNDVHSILEQNKVVADASAEPLEFTPRRSRRKSDYVFAMICGNAAMIVIVAFLPKNAVTLAFGFSGMVLYSVGVTWVMWMVMDDY